MPLLVTEPSATAHARDNQSSELGTPRAVKQMSWSAQKLKHAEASRTTSSRNSECGDENDYAKVDSSDDEINESVETNFSTRRVRDTSGKEEILRRRHSLISASKSSHRSEQRRGSEVIRSGSNHETSFQREPEVDERFVRDRSESNAGNDDMAPRYGDDVTSKRSNSDVISKRSCSDVTAPAPARWSIADARRGSTQEVKQAGTFFSSFDLTVDFSYLDDEQDDGHHHELLESPREDSNRYALTYREEDQLDSYRSSNRATSHNRRHCKGTLVDKKTGVPIMSLSTLKRVLRRHQLIQSKTNLKESARPHYRRSVKRRLRPQFSYSEKDETGEGVDESMVAASLSRTKGREYPGYKINDMPMLRNLDSVDNDNSMVITTEGDVFMQNPLSPVSNSYDSVSINRNLSSSDFLMKSTVADTNSLHNFNVTSSTRYLNAYSNSHLSVKDDHLSGNPRNISNASRNLSSRGDPNKKHPENPMTECPEEQLNYSNFANSEPKQRANNIDQYNIAKINASESDRCKTRTLTQKSEYLGVNSWKSPKLDDVDDDYASCSSSARREKMHLNESSATFELLDSRNDGQSNNASNSLQEIKAEHWWLNKRFQPIATKNGPPVEQTVENDASDENTASVYISETSEVVIDGPLIKGSLKVDQEPLIKIPEKKPPKSSEKHSNKSPSKVARCSRPPKFPLRSYRNFGASGRYFNAVLPRNRGRNVGIKTSIIRESESPSQTDYNTESAGGVSFSTESVFFKHGQNRPRIGKANNDSDVTSNEETSRYGKRKLLKRFGPFNRPGKNPLSRPTSSSKCM